MTKLNSKNKSGLQIWRTPENINTGIPVIKSHNIMCATNYISAKEAAHIAGVHKSHVCRLCRNGAFESGKVGNSWLILRSSAENYVRAKPGLKLGQKINRNKK
jgi:excisionase family DNA binding protein